jgi:hypothetical protein
MSTVMLELRTPVMTLVEASWEEPNGVSQRVTACMEDKSAGGACIRFQTPIRVGSRLRVQWRFDQFSGIARYCRREGREYLVGMQRDSTMHSLPNRPIPTDVPPRRSMRTSDTAVSTAKPQGLPKRQESMPNQMPAAGRNGESAIAVRTETFAGAPPRRGINYETDSMIRPRIRHSREFGSPRRTEFPKQQSPKSKEPGKERKSMGRKWLELAPWHSKQDGSAESGGGPGEVSRDANSNPRNDKENRMPHITQPTEKSPVLTAREVPTFQVELLPVDDIYRAAGIMNPRRGYSINKVVEMLQSEHIRAMSKEMKQAAVLMALDAAGIQMDQVRQDAKVRQESLDTYEAGQKKLVEAVWARKAEEVVQIQAELESVKAHHLARINRNLEGVAREKVTFNNWLTLKQQETQKMAEAVELCMKSPAAESAKAPHSEVGKEKAAAAATAGAKPV